MNLAVVKLMTVEEMKLPLHHETDAALQSLE
jgi:hypothetical protein